MYDFILDFSAQQWSPMLFFCCLKCPSNVKDSHRRTVIIYIVIIENICNRYGYEIFETVCAVLIILPYVHCNISYNIKWYSSGMLLFFRW